MHTASSWVNWKQIFTGCWKLKCRQMSYDLVIIATHTTHWQYAFVTTRYTPQRVVLSLRQVNKSSSFSFGAGLSRLSLSHLLSKQGEANLLVGLAFNFLFFKFHYLLLYWTHDVCQSAMENYCCFVCDLQCKLHKTLPGWIDFSSNLWALRWTKQNRTDWRCTRLLSTCRLHQWHREVLGWRFWGL